MVRIEIKSDKLCAPQRQPSGVLTEISTESPSASTTFSDGETRYVQLSPSWITVKTAPGVEPPGGKIRISPVRLFVLPLVGLVFGRTWYRTEFPRIDDPMRISIQLS